MNFLITMTGILTLTFSNSVFTLAYGQEKEPYTCEGANLDWAIGDLENCGEEGFSSSQSLAGVKYLLGVGGVEKSYVKAKYWLLMGAKSKHRLAQYYIGSMYQFGWGYPKDDEDAMMWYLRSAEQGYSVAQRQVGAMYAAGQGVSEDINKSVKWYNLAAQQGEASAQMLMGNFYAKGKGVPEDDVLAFMWYNLSAAQGNDIAIKNREIIRNLMTREQVAEAQKLSREWIAEHQ